MQLVVDGKISMAPRFLVLDGKEAAVGDMDDSGKNGKILKIKAERVQPAKDNRVSLLVTVESLENGKRRVIATPQIIAIENERATLEWKEEKRSMRLSALVSRAP